MAPPALALEPPSTLHLRPKVPEQEKTPEPVAGAPAQLQEQPPALPRNKKREGDSSSAVSSYSENGPWRFIANICSARLYAGRAGGAAGDCLQSQTTKQERFTGG